MCGIAFDAAQRVSALVEKGIGKVESKALTLNERSSLTPSL
jgi:hypothetical protein